MSDITVVVDCNDADFARDIYAALQQFPDVTALLPHHQATHDAQYASYWFPDPQLLNHSSGLKLIQATSAGVGHLPPALFTSEIPLCRVIDEDFHYDMFEYALWNILWFQRHLDQAPAHQRTQAQKLYPQRATVDFRIGIMGLGEVGGYIADQLARLGYRVSGQSRSEKQLIGVTCYCGEGTFDHFLGSLDGLISLLPLTAQTQGILAAPLFNQLPAGVVLINCGRGEHMVNDDVLTTLESDQLTRTILDIFPQEPLPADDPLWRHPQVVITPHMAPTAPAGVIARQLLENIQRQRRRLPLKNLVNRHADYRSPAILPLLRLMGGPQPEGRDMKIDLSEKVALVAASTTGTGFAIAKGLVESNAEIVINGRSEQSANATIARLQNEASGAKARPAIADLSDADDTAQLLRAATGINILVDNAGVYGPQGFYATDDTTWDNYWQTSVMSDVRLSRGLFPAMASKGRGQVVFIFSESARSIPADMIHYGVTKTVQLSLTRGLTKCVAGSGVTANSVLPGPTISDGFAEMLKDDMTRTDKSLGELAKAFVMTHRSNSVTQRAASAEEVADMVIYIYSPQASVTFDAILRVDGGMVDDIL